MQKWILLFLAIMIVAGCSMPDFDKLGLPTWNTTFEMYLLNDTYQAVQLADEDSSLVAFGETLGLYKTASDAGNVNFSMKTSSNDENMEIGDININDPDPTSTSILLAEVDPNLNNGPVPEPGILPFILPEIVKDDVEPFNEFQEISFLAGTMRISLTNNTAIWFGDIDAGHPLIVHILDMNDNELLAQPFSEDIPPDNSQTISEYMDMTGQTMVNEIKIAITGGSRGTDGQAALIDLDSTLDIELEVTDLVADYVIAHIPEQTIEDFVIVDLDENLIIYQGDIAEGNHHLLIEIENFIDMEMEALLYINYLTISGQSSYFSQMIDIQRSGGSGQSSYQTEVIEISQATLGKKPDFDVLLTTITLNVEALVLDSGDEYREISFEDAFNINVTVSDLEFTYLKGIIYPQEQEVISGSTTLDMNYPYVAGELEVVSFSKITFDFFTPIHTDIEVEFYTYNSEDMSAQLKEFDSGDNPVFNLAAGQSEVVFTSDEYNINELISILPDSVYYLLHPIAGDSTEVFEFFSGDEISVEIIIESELDFAADCWIIPRNDNGEPDVQKVDTKEFGQEIIDTYLNGKVFIHYNNNLGIDSGANVLISLHKPEGFEELMVADTTSYTVIKVPSMLYSNGNELETIEVDISRNDLNFFLADSVYIVPKLRLYSEPGTPLSGAIKLQAGLSLELEISSDLIE